LDRHRARSFPCQSEGISRLPVEPGEAVTALFEDREGNVWIGSANGIERLRDSVFATYSVPEGLSENNGPVYVDPQNRTWFAPENGGLYSLSDGKIASVSAAGLDEAGLEHDIVYSIAGNSGGLWIGRQRGGLTHLISNGESLTAKSYTTADGLAQNTVLAVSISRDGTVWAGTLNGGVSRFHDGRFTTLTSTNGLASNTERGQAPSVRDRRPAWKTLAIGSATPSKGSTMAGVSPSPPGRPSIRISAPVRIASA
jgi:ligand-binding sensor domain-containing protein